jgi:hypothetical protein
MAPDPPRPAQPTIGKKEMWRCPNHGRNFASGEPHVGVRPKPRPRSSERSNAAEPVLKRKISGIADAKPALFWRIDQKQSAERPERLAAKTLFAFLIDRDDSLAAAGDFAGRN